MQNVYIRKAVPGDAESISQLIRQNAFNILKPHYTHEQWMIFLKYYSPEVVTDKIATQTIFCGISGVEIVGCIGLDKNFVVGFYVRFQNLNQGIGKVLMDYLEAHARELGLTELQLAASPEGLRFYYKNGWRKIRDFVVDHYGVGFHETLMARDLTLPE